MELSNIPRDLLEEIISRLPVSSVGALRLTCKKLNTSFGEKHMSEAESMVLMVMDNKVYIVDPFFDPYIERKGKLISLEGLDDQVGDISQTFHCDGLLLCVMKNKNLVVWNPYTAETKWIEPRDCYDIYDHYAIGYDKRNISCRINKILILSDGYYFDGRRILRAEIYDLNTDSWLASYTTSQEGLLIRCSVSIKGNAYWLATQRILTQGQEYLYLICFDFTEERFGPDMYLPFKCYTDDTLALSSVREEQLVLLIHHSRTRAMEIWVTCNIEPGTVPSWKLFLEVDRTPLASSCLESVGFFIEEEKKIAVVLDKNEDNTRYIANIIEENGYIGEVDIGEVTDKSCNSCYVHVSRNLKENILCFD